MILTENKDAADQEQPIVVVKLKPEIKEQMMVLCERFPLKDVILVWLLLKKCTNNKLVLEGVTLNAFNYFIFGLLINEPYKDVVDVLTYLKEHYGESNTTE